MNDYFCGWYFRCQAEDKTLAVIPAVHISKGARSASVQLISCAGNQNAALAAEGAAMSSRAPRAKIEACLFSEDTLRLNLRADGLSAVGELRFDGLSPIRYDIMGPFRYVPFMECRHSVFSMRHRVNGELRVNGTDYNFRDGVGYIEGDRGRSFPRHYAWTQSFFSGGSIMLSVAEIPMGPLRFTGVIGIVLLNGKEYRLATYLGAKAVKISDGEIVIRQGDIELTAALIDKSAYTLRAPSRGTMTRLIRENVSCRARYRLTKGGRILLSIEAPNAAFEYEYP